MFKKSIDTDHIISNYELASRYKQLMFKKKIYGLDWKVNVKEGELIFGHDLVYKIHLVGSYTKSTQRFLYSNQNKHSNVGPLGYTVSLKYQRNLEKFLKQDDLEKHHIHLLAGYISVSENSEAYYLGSYGIGSVLLILDSKFNKILEPLIFKEAFELVKEQYNVNHLDLLKGFASKMNFRLKREKDKYILSDSKNTVGIKFDGNDRLLEFVL